MKSAVIYNKNSNEIAGIVEVSVDSDLALNVPPSCVAIEIEPTHQIRGEQKNWYVENGTLRRRSNAEIVKDNETDLLRQTLPIQENLRKINDVILNMELAIQTLEAEVKALKTTAK